MAMLWFYCDESFDSGQREPNTFVVAGLLAEEWAWQWLEKWWAAENFRVGVKRYHASRVNALGGEFEGWDKSKRDEYIKHLFQALASNGLSFLAVSCGIHADEYRKIINEKGRETLGSPYIVCFKTCLLVMAKILMAVDSELKFSVILERNPAQTEAVDIFYKLKDDVAFGVGGCMGTCAPGSWQEFTALQVADMVAYETFRQVHKREGPKLARRALQTLYSALPMTGVYFDAATLNLIKPDAEGATCPPNCFFPTFSNFEPNLSGEIDENEP
jgi:hypothetical protein